MIPKNANHGIAAESLCAAMMRVGLSIQGAIVTRFHHPPARSPSGMCFLIMFW
jgi:hypothetical protein